MIDYKIKDITLDERLDITDKYNKDANALRTNVSTLRETLTKLGDVIITDENRDQEINKLSSENINIMGYEIAGKINHFQDKKKQ